MPKFCQLDLFLCSSVSGIQPAPEELEVLTLIMMGPSVFLIEERSPVYSTTAIDCFLFTPLLGFRFQYANVEGYTSQPYCIGSEKQD